MHFKCFKSVAGINSTHTKKNDIKQVCVLFSGYLPLRITPPIFNMGSMLTGQAANLAYHAPLGQFVIGTNLFTWTNQMRKKCLLVKTHLGYIKYNRFHGNPEYKLNFDSIHSKLIISQPMFNINGQSWY